MAKTPRLPLSNAILFVFLFCLLISTEMTMVEAKLCQRRSKTWTGVCVKSGNCDHQCKTWEKASHGACHIQFPGSACFCYFNC